jgi:hypothetical protein
MRWTTRLDGIFQCKSWLVAYQHMDHQQAAEQPAPARPGGRRPTTLAVDSGHMASAPAFAGPPHGRCMAAVETGRRTAAQGQPEPGAKLQLGNERPPFWLGGVCSLLGAPGLGGCGAGFGRKGPW